MSSARRRPLVALACTLFAAIGVTARSDEGSSQIINVITIDTRGDYDGFLAAHRRARAIYARIDSGKRRLVRDGANPNVVHVIVEFENERAMRDAAAKRNEDPEMAVLIKQMASAGWRTLSTQVWTDVTPPP